MSDVDCTVDLSPVARFAFFMHHEKGSMHEGELGRRGATTEWGFPSENGG